MVSETDVQQLIAVYQRRLQNLERKKAIFGYNVPSEVLMEIEDIQATISKLQQQIARAGSDGGESTQDNSSAVSPKQAYNDKVAGDKVLGDLITVGNVTGTGIAIGRGAHSSVIIGPSNQEMASISATLAQIVQNAPPDRRPEVETTVGVLKNELAKGSQADDKQVATHIERLMNLAPNGRNAIVELFASPTLKGTIGPITGFVLEKMVA